jgi:exodeoxyribonuclease-5
MIIYNQEQLDAIDSCVNFINKGNPSEFYLIEGKAGTGKTTVIKEIIKRFSNKKFVVGALAHKAKNVIRESIEKDNIKANITYNSIAGMINLQLDLETGMFKEKYNPDQKKMLYNYNIIIIDEGSMVNEESIDLIFQKKNKYAKVIFLGDIGQLPPIRTKDNPYYSTWSDIDLSKNSPVFETKNKSKLLIRVRQGEESPILPYADFFWNNSQLDNPRKNPTNLNDRKTIINSKGALIFVNETKEIYGSILKLFDISIKENKSNLIKFVSYRNATREKINKHIHSYFFGKDCTTFQKGELIIFNDNFGDIENSSEFQIIERYPDFYDKKDNLLLYSIDIIFDNNIKQLVLLHPDSYNDHQNLIKRKFNEAFATKKEINEYTDNKIKKGDKFYYPDLTISKNSLKDKYKKQLEEAWSEKFRFPNIDYAYCVSCHKSQGSTYDTVIVHEQDIVSVTKIDDKQKSQSLYTAITRAKNITALISSERIYNDIHTSTINFIEINEKINNGK